MERDTEYRRKTNAGNVSQRRRRPEAGEEGQRRIERARKMKAKKKRLKRQKCIIIMLLVVCAMGFTVCGVSNIRKNIREEKAKQQEVQEKKEAAQKKKEEAARKKAEEEKREKEKTEALQADVEELLGDFKGEWSVYIQKLNTGSEVIINNQQIYAASLIKLFVMEATYANMEQVMKNATNYLGSEERAKNQIEKLLKYMIEYSDNECYNELIRMQSEDRDFLEGCSIINSYLQEKEYSNTEIHMTLHPSHSKSQNDGLGQNMTSVKDCGKLLEKIYKGECVSEEASANMLEHLLNQQKTHKIPDGLPEGTKVANKTGETSKVQHDTAIIYAEKEDFILCIMTDNIPKSSNIYGNIHNLTATVYNKLNDKSGDESDENSNEP